MGGRMFMESVAGSTWCAQFQAESYEILHPKANRIFTLSILINVFRLNQAGLISLRKETDQ